MAAALSSSIIGLVSCSKTKLGHRAPARELYCSPLFQKSLRYLECHAMEIGVISAKHGLRFIDDELDPYDLTLNDMTRAERDEWALGVRNEINEHWGSDVRFWFCGGMEYTRPIRGLPGKNVLKSMQIGERLSWLNKRIAQDEPKALHGYHVWVPVWPDCPDGFPLGNVSGPTIEIATQFFWDPERWPLCNFTTRTLPRKRDITWRKVKTWTEPIAVRRQQWLKERGLAPQETT